MCVERELNTTREPGRGRRASALWLIAGLAVVIALVVVAVLASRPSPAPDRASAHPAIKPEQACTSCKAPRHSYVHDDPYKGDCSRCHVTSSWRRTFYVHANTEMDLGMHPVIGCGFCHTASRPRPNADCGTCHDSKHAALPSCGRCHTAISFRLIRPVPKEHITLEYGHSVLSCFSCHIGPAAFESPKACVDCHGVRHGGLTQCGQCHDPSLQWRPKAGFDHDEFYVLSGLHRRVLCARCHPGGNFAAASPRCASCHGVKHGGLRDCSSCHTTSGFKPSTFRHSRVFVLTGRHARLRCTACHPKRLYARNISTGSGCVGCHGARHGGLTNCARCHTTTSFAPSTFRHSTVFVLVGAHSRLACTACHPGRRYASNIRTGPGCTGCHGSAHGGLKDCARCHTQTSFMPPTFKHSSIWPLTGAHARIECSKCHPRGDFTDAIGNPNACTNCHGVRHGNQTACEDCHTTTAFVPAKAVAHPGFPALGAKHAARSCRLCHPTLVFNGPTKPCRDCHTAPHVEPTDCLSCHRPTVWSEVHFTHSDIGYHTGLPIGDICEYCHTTGNYGTYRCNRCHTPY